MSDRSISTPIAIIGMACRLPGADNLEAYWALLRDGGDAIGELAEDRIDRSLYFHPEKGVRGRTYSSLGGTISSLDVDATQVPLLRAHLDKYDVCHLILAEVAVGAARHAGLTTEKLSQANIGVYVGHSAGSSLGGDIAYGSLAAETADYLRDVNSFSQLPPALQSALPGRLADRLRSRRPVRNPDGTPHTEANMAAAAIARALGLDGPQLVVDAACASSLVSLALAAIDLQDGRIDAAVVGAASFNRCDSLILFSQAQSCSASGSRPFDARADGLISSEGYVAIVAKRLDRAIADGDRIHAVIRGIGLACDGRGRSLWAPRKEGQAAAIRRAYGDGVDLRSVQYIEAHATSTQLGDATELEALAEVFADVDGSQNAVRIPIGSVKANMGHTLETAGLASLLKVVLAINHRIIPPVINVETLSPVVPWDRLPFELNLRAVEWPSGRNGNPRRAGVSAFGIGGLNVHLLVDEYEPAQRHSAEAMAPHLNGDAVFGHRSANLVAAPRSHGKPRETKASGVIAVIGRGAILPGAQSMAELRALIRRRTVCISDAPPDRWRHVPGSDDASRRRGGFITDYRYDWERHKIPPRQIERANPLQFMLLDAASQALGESGYDHRPLDRLRAGVVIGTVFGGEFGHNLQVGLRMPELRRELRELLYAAQIPDSLAGELLDEYEARVFRAKPALLDETGSFTCSTLASRVSKTLDFMGGALAIDASDSSALAALTAACQLLRSRACDFVLCGAAQRAMDLPSYEFLQLHGVLAPDGDGGSDGYVPGEGVAMVALKRREDAERDGDKVLALIHGEGAASNSVDPVAAFEAAARRALAFAGRSATEVRRISAGCHIARFDAPQTTACESVFGRPSTQLPLISQIGYLQAAHGLVALLHDTLTPENEQCDDAPLASVATYGNNGLAHHVVYQVLPQPVEHPPTLLNVVDRSTTAHVEPKNDVRPVKRSSLRSGERILRLGTALGGSVAELAAKCEQDADSLFRSAGPTSFRPTDAVRLAIRARDSQDLAEKCALVVRRGADPGARHALLDQGIAICETAASPGRIAMLFPGQGSQAPRMGLDIAAASAAARQRMAEADAILGQFGEPGYADLVSDSSSGLGTDVWRTQVAMLLADLLWFDALVERGIKPAYLSGHSYGEFAALVAAGVWTLEQAMRLTRARANAITSNCGAVGGMLALAATVDAAERLIGDSGLRITISHENSPRQTVVGGAIEDVTQLSRLAAERRISAQILPVPAAFHTPLLQNAQSPWRDALSAERLYPPQIPLLDNAGQKFVADPHEIREGLVAQLVHPVRYTGLVRRLCEYGTTVLLEVGPRQILTRLHREIVGGAECTCVASDHANIDVRLQLDWLTAVMDTFAVRRRVDLNSDDVWTAEPRNVGLIDEFDATAGRRKNRRSKSAARRKGHQELVARQAIVKAAEASASETERDSELAAFLVEFVVDQTGYPSEVVTIDADLEADLGIDSIKKAQLFGELREQFGLTANTSGSVRLAEFRTLRDVLTLLRTVETSTDSASRLVVAGPAPALVAVESTSTVRQSTAVRHPMAATAARRTVAVEHQPTSGQNGHSHDWAVEHDPTSVQYQTGLQRGREEAAQIRSLLRTVVDDALAASAALRSDEIRGVFTPEELSELQGLADGAAVHVNGLLAYHYRHRDTAGMGLVGAPRDVSPAPSPSKHNPAKRREPGLPTSTEAEPAKEPRPQVTSRYVLRMQDSPRRKAPLEPRLNGAALIIGDNTIGYELRDRCLAAGVPAHVLASTPDTAGAVQTLNEVWGQQPVTHLFIVSPCDADAVTVGKEPEWRHRRFKGLHTPFWVCQRWLHLVQAAGLMEDATLVGVTCLGGDFGFSADIVSAEGGGIAGLLKAIVMESWVNGHRTIPIKLLDTRSDERPAAVVDAIWKELAAPSYDVEISWTEGERKTVCAVPMAATSSPSARLPRGTWVCTGGARGITAYVATELGRKYGLNLHLVGTAPEPQVPPEWRNLDGPGLAKLKRKVMQAARSAGHNALKEWQKTEKALEIDATLRSMQSAGVRAKYHSCDVSDREALAAVLEEIRRSDGPIRGVLHGAGFGQDARFDRKDPDKVEQCLAAKLDGGLSLMELTQDDPLDHFVAFGSISGRFGANGHTDYSLANDMLAKLVGWYRAQRPDVAAVTFHWHAWGDVGMATKPETKLALEMINMRFMPAREGLQHLIQEFEAGVPESEVLITDEMYHRAFYPTENVTTASKSAEALLDPEPSRVEGDWHVCTAELDPATDPFLREHRLGDKPLLPLVIGLELAAEAAQRLTGRTDAVRFRVIRAVRGLKFVTDRSEMVRVRARNTGTAVECQIVSDFRNRDGEVVERDRVHLTLVMELSSGGDVAARPSLPGDGQFRVIDYPSRDAQFYAGPPLQCLRKICTAPGVAWGRIGAPSLGELAGLRRPPGRWTVPAAALDACLHAVAHLAWEQIAPGATLPAGIGSLDLYRLPRPGEPCIVEVRAVEQGSRSARFDFTLHGDDGEPVLTARDYEISWLQA